MRKSTLWLRHIYKNTKWGFYLIGPIKTLYDFIIYRMIPKQIFIKLKFRLAFGYQLDLHNPKTLNEKIQWLKLFYNNLELHTTCADKYAVKQYIKEQIGESYVVPLIFETFNYLDIKKENIPDYPVIIKATHNSGGFIILKNKKSANWEIIQRDCKRWLKENYYYIGKEVPYKNIPPRIIVEKLLIDDEGNIPLDYKVHCFNGLPQMIQVDLYRGTAKHARNWYNTNWQREPYRWSSLYPDGKLTDPCDEDAEKPVALKKMLKLSAMLSKKFKYVRIDWYILDNQIYFGEFTFHHDGGLRPILPEKYDLILGNRLNLQ